MEIKYVTTTCPHCGVGCAFNLVVKDGKVTGVQPSQRGPVNEGKICHRGMNGWECIVSEDRLKTPLIKDKNSGSFKPASWDEALALIATNFKKYNSDEIAVVSSSRCSNEDSYAIQKFARVALKTSNIDNSSRNSHSPTIIGLYNTFGIGATTNSFDDISMSDCIFVIGSNNIEINPLASRKIMLAKNKGAHVIVCDPRVTPTSKQSDLHLQQYPGTDIQLLNCIMKQIIERGFVDKDSIKQSTGFEELKACVTNDKYSIKNTSNICGIPEDKIEKAIEWLKECQHKTVFVYSTGITQHTVGVNNVQSIAFVQALLGNIGKPGCGIVALSSRNNAQGACDMGAMPEFYPGYVLVTDTNAIKNIAKYWGVSDLPSKVGLTTTEMMETLSNSPGKVKCMYIVGENLAMATPDLKKVETAMNNCEFVVVQDLFETETAKYADVILPSGSYAEKDGTHTNSERRVQRIRKAVDAPGESKIDWEIIKLIADKMGCGQFFNWQNSEDVFKEICGIVPQYTGMTYEKLNGDGTQWPCPSEDNQGTPVLYSSGNIKCKFEAIEQKSPAESIDDAFPIWLTTSMDSSVMYGSCRSALHKCMHHATIEDNTPWIELNEVDANEKGISNGDKVIVSSKRGEVELKAKVTTQIKQGVAYIPVKFVVLTENSVVNTAYDPLSKIPEYKVCAINVKKMEA